MPIVYSSHLRKLAPELISEVASLSEQIFEPPAIDYFWRLTRMPEVSLFCAREEGRLLAFKAGYAIAERKYYSWLGAVAPDRRNQGIASELARRQHAWLRECGFSVVETSSRNNNSIMTRINLASGFVMIGTKIEPHGVQVLWSKKLV